MAMRNHAALVTGQMDLGTAYASEDVWDWVREEVVWRDAFSSRRKYNASHAAGEMDQKVLKGKTDEACSIKRFKR